MPKNVPLRDWASNSYDPKTGRAASSLMNDGAPFSCEGMRITPNKQLPRRDAKAGGAMSWGEMDERNTQGSTPVKDRPIG
jgi:hypothetical protein